MSLAPGQPPHCPSITTALDPKGQAQARAALWASLFRGIVRTQFVPQAEMTWSLVGLDACLVERGHQGYRWRLPHTRFHVPWPHLGEAMDQE